MKKKVQVHLDQFLARRFKAVCAKEGITQTQALEAMVEIYVAGVEDGPVGEEGVARLFQILGAERPAPSVKGVKV